MHCRVEFFLFQESTGTDRTLVFQLSIKKLRPILEAKEFSGKLLQFPETSLSDILISLCPLCLVWLRFGGKDEAPEAAPLSKQRTANRDRHFRVCSQNTLSLCV